MAHASSNSVVVRLGNGDATYQPAQVIPAGPSPSSPVVADLNGDGLPDVAALNANGFSVLLNDGVWDGEPPPPPPPPLPALTIGDVTVTEGNSGSVTASFTATLSKTSTEPLTVNYTTADGSALAGSDYQAASGTLTFAPGETSMTITVSVLGDTVVEPNESFHVNLSNAAGATLTDGQGIGTIVNDDVALPKLRISDVTKKEGRRGTTSFTFTVTLSAPSTVPVTVNWSTADGTAQESDGDYTAASGTLTFAPGETTKTITIKVRGDRKKEANETFFVNLLAATGALIEDDQGLGTILNDD